MSKKHNQETTRMDMIECSHAARSGAVFSAARKRHLALGHDVVIARDDTIVRLTPDGESHFIKHISPPRCVPLGDKIKLR